MRRLLIALLFPVAAGATPALAAEAVIRGDRIEFPQTQTRTHIPARSSAMREEGAVIVRGAPAAAEAAPVYSGSSMPPAFGTTTILRGSSRSVEIVRQAPAANLGGDTDGPVINNPACLYTEPPTCTR